MPAPDDANCTRCGRSHPENHDCVPTAPYPMAPRPMAQVIPFRARVTAPIHPSTSDDPDGPSAA